MSAPGNKQRRPDGGRNDWQTPPELFRLLDDEFDFDIDAAASRENALCQRFFSEEDSAFDHELSGGWRVFANPPYGNLKPWVDLFAKWAEQGNTVVALMPSATDTEWWMSAYLNASEIRLLSGRVKFINPATVKPDGSNTTGSTVFVFGGPHLDEADDFWLWDWRTEL